MALFQIAEPGDSPAPHKHRLAVGIDLGTTNSLVAAVKNGHVVVLHDENGRAILPSLVYYTHKATVIVGHEAQREQSNDPKNCIASVKRFMGRSMHDINLRDALPYDYIDSPGMLKIQTRAGEKSPVEVSAEILRVLKERTEAAFGTDVSSGRGELAGAVITVPAYFDDAQRQATKDAAELAGINVLRLLNEPTAAAIAYGLDNQAEGIYAVYDLGGGTFDISILRLSHGVFEVIATGGDSALGGDDFDHRIYCWLLEREKLSRLPAADVRHLMLLARDCKELLTTHAEAKISTELSDGRRIDRALDAATFAEITHTLVNKSLQAVNKTLRDAHLEKTQIAGVVMVGGATRMPQVQKIVGEFFAQEPLTNLDPDKVVALGAAMQANLLAGNRGSGEDWLLLDVIPLSLGVETMGGLVDRIIPRNSTLPIARAQEFTTFKDGQTAMAIQVVQGERDLASDCRSLARFELRNIPPMVAGAAKVRVTFKVDADGLLSVTAHELTSGVETNVSVKPSYGIGDDEIAAMLKDSHEHAKEDAFRRALKEAQVDAQRLIEATEAALAADSHLLSGVEASKIRAAMKQLAALSLSEDRQQITKAMDVLNETTEGFAQLRMNEGVRQALSGRHMDELSESAT